MKLEFSYTKMFGRNLLACLIFFAVFDLILEQLLTRIFMSEALLISPILGALVTSEFITTLGAQDFQSFITAYFAQSVIQILSRTYVGPALEKLELAAQRFIVSYSRDHVWAEKTFKRFLVRHLHEQLQRVNLREYQGRGEAEEAAEGQTAAPETKEGGQQDVLDRDDGLEALLGSVATYAAHTQALFQVPIALVFLIVLAHETKMPQGYNIRHGDLLYYLAFCVVMIVPRLVVDVFLLHVLETLHGYKIYDYFTFCDYRFRIRTRKW